MRAVDLLADRGAGRRALVEITVDELALLASCVDEALGERERRMGAGGDHEAARRIRTDLLHALRDLQTHPAGGAVAPAVGGTPISERDLDRLEVLSDRCDPPPWTAMIEGRDHVAGDSFVMVGHEGERGEDLYVSRDSGPAGGADLDLVAAARTWLPALVAEVRRLRTVADPGGVAE